MASAFDNVMVSTFEDNGQVQTAGGETSRRLCPVIEEKLVHIDVFDGKTLKAW